MKNKKIEGNLAVFTAKTFSGLNMNALKFLLPVWMAPFSGTMFRLVFGALIFWIIGLFVKKEAPTTYRQKFHMFLLGAFGLYGYMGFYLWGLSHTTPVSSSIIMVMIPIWVFIILLIKGREKFDIIKGLGMLLGLCGAAISIFTKKPPEYADNPILGNLLTICSTIIYSVYLIYSHTLLKDIGILTLTKWTFLGGAFASVIGVFAIGYDARVFEMPLHWLPICILLFVLIFPTVLSYLLVSYGLKYLKTTLIAMYGYWIIVVATVVAVITGQDQFSWTIVISILMLCIGIYLVEVRESKENVPLKK